MGRPNKSYFPKTHLSIFSRNSTEQHVPHECFILLSTWENIAEFCNFSKIFFPKVRVIDVLSRVNLGKRVEFQHFSDNSQQFIRAILANVLLIVHNQYIASTRHLDQPHKEWNKQSNCCIFYSSAAIFMWNVCRYYNI